MGHLGLSFSSVEGCVVDRQNRNGLEDIFVGDDPDTLIAGPVNSPLLNLNFFISRNSPEVLLHSNLAGGSFDDSVVNFDASNINGKVAVQKR